MTENTDINHDTSGAPSDGVPQPLQIDRTAALYGNSQPAGDQAEQPQPASEQPAQTGDPEPYYGLHMPDGVELDKQLLTTATPVLREIGLSNDQANKLVPLVSEIQQRFYQTQIDEFDVMSADWARQTRADPEMGGSKWAETDRLMRVAIKAAGVGEGFREVIDESRLGNHPEIVRAFRRLGQRIETLERQVSTGRPPTREESLYPG